MKRLVLFAFAATCGLASCQKEEATPANLTAQAASADASSTTSGKGTNLDAAKSNCIDKLNNSRLYYRQSTYNYKNLSTESNRLYTCNCTGYSTIK